MIFQRGNPLDYERWAADPGMEEWDYAPLPALLQADGELPGRRRRVARRRRPADARARAGRPTRCSARSSRPSSEAGYPLTDDVNGYRQEGFAQFDRNVHRGRRLSAARAYLHPVAAPAEPRGRDLARSSTGIRFDGNAGGRRRLPAGRRGGRRTVDAGEVILCGGAINTPQLLQLSGVGTRRLLARARHPGRAPTCPGVGENLQDHLEVYIQYASKQPVSIAPGLKWRRRPRHRLPVALPPARARRHQPLRGRRLRPQQRRRRLPEPDVPLPADRDPVRRLGTDRRGTATRCTSGRCTPTPAGTCASSRPTRASTRRCGSTTSRPTNDRREWVEAIRVARDILNQPAFAPYNDGETLARALGRDRRGDPRLGARATPRRRCTPRARPGWASTTCRSSTRTRCGCTASRGCASSTPRSLPYVTNGNIYAPVMMVAEKAADLIVGNTPLARRQRAVLPPPRRWIEPALPARRQPQRRPNSRMSRGDSRR